MSELPTYSYYSELFSGSPMPFAFVDLDMMDRNIKAIASRSNGKRIRIASKSLRCAKILKYILEYGEPFQGIMAYHPREAAMLARQGFDDILLGYPFLQSSEIAMVLQECAQGKTIRFMIDHASQLERLDKEAAQVGVVAEFCLDIDMSTSFPGVYFGVYRSPLHGEQEVAGLSEAIGNSKNCRLCGIMGYEAQVAGVGDSGGGVKGAVIRLLKKKSLPEIAKRRKAVVEYLTAQGFELQIVNAGGTGSLESSSSEAWVTEVTAGSGFYSPGLFDHYSSFQHLPAAAFALEITRIPKPGMFTCAGGGYIASGETGVVKQPKPFLPADIDLIQQEGFGEVQTPFKYRGKENLTLGAPVFFRHAKAGELFERFNTVYLIKNGRIIDETSTYRGDGLCFV